MEAYSRIRAHIRACIADSVSYSVSVLVNRYRRSLRPPSSLPLPTSPLIVSLPTNARISSPHFSRVLRRYRADSLSLSLSSTQRCRKPSPRHRCCGLDGQWVQWTIYGRLLFVDRDVVDAPRFLALPFLRLAQLRGSRIPVHSQGTNDREYPVYFLYCLPLLLRLLGCQ